MADFLEGLLNFITYMASDDGLKDKMTMATEGNLLKILEAIWSWIGMCAIGLSLIYFVMELNQKIAFEGRDATLKSIYVPFAKFCFSLALFSHTGDIAGSFISIYNGGLDTISNKMTDILNSDVVTEAVEEGAEAVVNNPFMNSVNLVLENAKLAGFFVVIFFVLFCVIAVLVQFVINFMWDIKVFMFKIEFIWKLSTAPFSLADVYSEKNSQAFRFIKNMFALILSGIAMITLPAMAQLVVGESMNNMLNIEGDTITIREVLTLLRGIFEVALLPSFIALNAVSVAKSAIKEGLS